MIAPIESEIRNAWIKQGVSQPFGGSRTEFRPKTRLCVLQLELPGIGFEGKSGLNGVMHELAC